MKAVLLVNMGSPTSEKEMKQFLRRMFLDKNIIGAPLLIRAFLSFFISKLRYKKSWSKYELIGGSPLLASMKQIQDDLIRKTKNKYRVSCAYSYSSPLIVDEIDRLRLQGANKIVVIPMYPQASISTTGSLKNDLAKARKKFPDLEIRLMDEYYSHPGFIDFWKNRIKNKIHQQNYANPYLLFSAHAIPEYQIRQGDTYTTAIEKSAELISQSLNLPFSVSYQSKMGRMKWASPDTLEHLKELKEKGIHEIVIVPVSFLNENLETLYDLDREIIPYCQSKLNIRYICRIELPLSDENLIELFVEIIGNEYIFTDY